MTFSLGPVSTESEVEDVFAECLSTLENFLLNEDRNSDVYREGKKFIEECDRLLDNENTSTDEIEEALQELIPWMDGYAPDYIYFDKQDDQYGFWVDHDAIATSIHDGDLPHCDTIADNYQGLTIEVNDHGNMTLWMAALDDSGQHIFDEVWSCV